jgi:hypothetical protein
MWLHGCFQSAVSCPRTLTGFEMVLIEIGRMRGEFSFDFENKKPFARCPGRRLAVSRDRLDFPKLLHPLSCCAETSEKSPGYVA